MAGVGAGAEDIVEAAGADGDTAEAAALGRLFPRGARLLAERPVSLSHSYVTRMHGSRSLKVAASLSDNSLELYEITTTSLNKYCKLSGHRKPVSELVFSPENDNILYSASLDGLIKAWDIRASGSCVMEYKDEEDNHVRPLESFDVSCNGRVLCAGSELVQDDAFLIFWDQRQPKPLGGYWNSHTDDITQVRFHKDKPSLLATGSIDGLINTFDITEQTEDDALLYCLNVENSVQKISWIDSKTISCITQSNDFQLWDTDTGDKIKNFTREKIAHSIKRSKEDDCYLVDTYLTKDNDTAILAGSHGGDGHCLRSVTNNGKKLIPCTNFVGNKQIVRCCWQDRQKRLLVTAGEAGIISIWENCDENAFESGMSTLKAASSAKEAHTNRSKPY